MRFDPWFIFHPVAGCVDAAVYPSFKVVQAQVGFVFVVDHDVWPYVAFFEFLEPIHVFFEGGVVAGEHEAHVPIGFYVFGERGYAV